MPVSVITDKVKALHAFQQLIFGIMPKINPI